MKKLKNLAMNLAKKNLLFRHIARKGMFILRRTKYKIVSIFSKVDEKTVIFSCFKGKSYTCSPKALYEYMVSCEKYKDYKLVWFFQEPEKYKFLEENMNTIVVKYNSKEYKKYLHTSKYWIFNYKIPDYIKPTKNQVFVQCWHGTPLKRLGCDLQHLDNTLNTVEEMNKRYKVEAEKFSYFLSPSKYASERFISAWNLKEIGKEDIILEKGYPRNDFLSNFAEQDVQNVKQKILGENINKKVILYAPTYRSNQHETGVGYVYKEEVDFEKMRQQLGEEYVILFRPHYFIANVFDFNKYKGFVYNVSEVDDINELYIISDILITDYSSVFFDYAILKRPMIFYMYDLEHYRDESNGFYIDIEKELPGPIVKKEDEIIEEIRKIGNEPFYNEKYRKFNDKYNYLDDGRASQRVLEEIIK